MLRSLKYQDVRVEKEIATKKNKKRTTASIVLFGVTERESVDRTGIEPVTSTMPLWRSPMLS